MNRIAGRICWTALSVLASSWLGAGAPDREPAALLEPGSVVTRQIEKGQAHDYAIHLKAGEFVHLEVRQQGVDVVTTTHAVDGSPTLQFDSASGARGDEPVYLVAEQTGAHRIVVQTFGEEEQGSYEISVEELRTAGPEERERMRAEAAFSEGRRLRRERTAEARRSAIDSFASVLVTYRRLGDARREADTLTYLGGLHLALREAREALVFYETAIPLLEAGGQDRRVAVTLLNIGWCHDSLAEYQAALDSLGRALDRMRAQGLAGGEASALSSMGRILQALGDHTGALQRHRESGAIWKGLGAASGEAIALRNVGLVLAARGFPVQAEESFEEALRLFRDQGNTRRQAQCLLDLVDVQYATGEHDSALDRAESALALFRSLGERKGESRALRLSGRIRSELGDALEARSSLHEALTVSREVEDRDGEAEALYALALFEQRHGGTEQAVAHVESAIACIESMRSGVERDDLRSYYLASRQRYYDLHVELLMELDLERPSALHRTRALGAAERGRARALLEGVARARVDLPQEPEAELSVDATQALLDDATALVTYEMAGEQIFAFIVTSGTLQVQRLGVSPSRILDRVENFVEVVAGGHDADWRSIARRLGNELVVPWLGRIPDRIRHLIVVPDGILHYLPFEALIVDEHDRLLIERFTVSYAPSAAVLGRLRDRTADPDASRVVVLAQPEPPGTGVGQEEASSTRSGTWALYQREGFSIGQLPFTAIEAGAVQRYAGPDAEIYTGREATEEVVKNGSARKARLLHFATHGLVSQWSPELSALVLAAGSGDGEDGFLQAREIYSLELNSELVVLSACQTARGRLLAGEGVQGLVQAFLHAGARSVVASLWNVRDDRTTTLMSGFYRHLARGLPKGEALRAAKLELLANEATASPRFWASFILLGDAHSTISLTPPGSGGRGRRTLVAVGLIVAVLLAAFVLRPIRSTSRGPRGEPLRRRS